MLRMLFAVFLLAACLYGQEGPRGQRLPDATRDSSTAQLADKDKRWALLIGVDEYEDTNISQLHGAANDARAMKQVLVERAGFPENQVLLMVTGETGTLRPTRANVIVNLSNLLGVVPKDGLLLVQFSGHGIERQGRPFLLPMDARLNDNPRVLENLSISVAMLREMIEREGIAQVLVLLDACRNEPGGRSTDSNPLTQPFVDDFRFDIRNRGVEAYAIFHATGVGYRAWEDRERKRGHFSLAFEEGLRGAAANDRGEVTLGGLRAYLEQTVPTRVALDVGRGNQQRPFTLVEGFRYDELVLALAPRHVLLPGEDLCEVAWRMVRETTRREEVEGFLQECPNCQYAPLARIRLRGMQPASPAQPNVSDEQPVAPAQTGDRMRPPKHSQDNTFIAKVKRDRGRLVTFGQTFMQWCVLASAPPDPEIEALLHRSRPELDQLSFELRIELPVWEEIIEAARSSRQEELNDRITKQLTTALDRLAFSAGAHLGLMSFALQGSDSVPSRASEWLQSYSKAHHSLAGILSASGLQTEQFGFPEPSSLRMTSGKQAITDFAMAARRVVVVYRAVTH